MEVIGNPPPTWQGYVVAHFTNAQSYPGTGGGVPVAHCNYSSYHFSDPNNYFNTQTTANNYVAFKGGGAPNRWQGGHGFDYCYGIDWKSTEFDGSPLFCYFEKKR